MEKSEVQRKVQLATSEEVFPRNGAGSSFRSHRLRAMCICAMRMSSACSDRAIS